MKRFTEWLRQRINEGTTFPYVLHRPSGAIQVIVSGEYHQGSRGPRDRFGVPQEPDEGPEFEIDAVMDQNGNEVEISDKEYTEIVNAFFKREI